MRARQLLHKCLPEGGNHGMKTNDRSRSLQRLARNLRGKRASDLLQEARLIARDNPALIAVGGIAIGLGIALLARGPIRRRQEARPHHHADWGVSAAPRRNSHDDDLETAIRTGLRNAPHGSDGAVVSGTLPTGASLASDGEAHGSGRTPIQ